MRKIKILILVVVGFITADVKGQITPPVANSQAASLVATNSWIARSGSAKLYTIIAGNQSTNDVWMHVFDTNALPANGDYSTLVPVKIAAGSSGFIDFPAGYNFSLGIVICASTTDVRLTNTTACLKMNVSFYNKAY